MSPRARKPPEPPFDPYRIFQELDQHRVTYILVGGLARVLHGSDEITRGFDLTPRQNESTLTRLEQALTTLEATRIDRKPLDLANTPPEREPLVELTTNAGRVNVVHRPAGTQGYDDLRYKATREHLGNGIRVDVASPGDLTRMLETHHHTPTPHLLDDLRRITELERNQGRGIGR